MMKNKEKIELKERLKENFIKDFDLENLKVEEKEFFLNSAYYAMINCDRLEDAIGAEYITAYNSAIAYIQNFHILKALKDNNDKLDTTIQQNNQIIELLTKLVEKSK